MKSVFKDVEKHTHAFSLKWEKAEYTEDLIKKHGFFENRKRQKDVTETINSFFGLLGEKENVKDDSLWIKSLKERIMLRARLHLEIQNEDLECDMLNGMMQSTEKFIEKAREYDPDLKPADIMQAMRNVWIMNLLQLTAGKKAEYIPSIFAYSMLYPYTDNFLDDTDISDEKKSEFNKRLSLRLKGGNITPQNEHEKKVFGLIEIIEEQYPRDEYEGVYDSILSIQNAQIKSLSQQDGCDTVGESELVLISAEKGGTSVLADAYLVCGDLDDNLFEFAFGFGFILQLIDDLQDAASDCENNHMTVFSCIANKKKLDYAAGKLIAFIDGGIDYDALGKSPYMKDIRKLIVDNCILMLFEAVSKNRRFFSRTFLSFAKKHSALSLSFFKRANRKIKRKMKPLMDAGII